MPDIMEVVPARQFAKRVWQEQMAGIRSSPVGPVHLNHTRDARIRREIDLALLAAGKRGVAEKRAQRAATSGETPRFVVCSSPTRLPPLTARVQQREYVQQPYLRGSQVASGIAEVGSYSSRGLTQLSARFKNQESPLPFFN